MTDTGQLAGRHAFVTGAASGIGRATAELFAERGAMVTVVDAQGDLLAQVAEAIGATALVVDLTDRAATIAAVHQAAEAMGGLDAIANIAGVTASLPLDSLDADSWDRHFAVNATAPYEISRAALPYLRRRKGSTIVTVASGQALLPNAPGAAAYCASKAAVTAFTKNIAAELAPDIRANVVCPGLVHTPMVQSLFEGYDDPADAPFVAQYAMKRPAEPRELAEVIAFCSSDAASYLTGAAIAADGGRTFH